MPSTTPLFRRTAVLASACACAALLAGCASPPRQRTERAPIPEPLPPVTEVTVYPSRGQSARELRRDRFECHEWAVRQSGFDPATMSVRMPTPVPRVEPDPPVGYGTAAGAVTGAVVGAAVSSPRHTGQGAAVGAVVGAVAGAASDAAREARAGRIEDAYAVRAARHDAEYAEDENRYRRALSACLEGRGYTVR